jgi:hypothetical protein
MEWRIQAERIQPDVGSHETLDHVVSAHSHSGAMETATAKWPLEEGWRGHAATLSSSPLPTTRTCPFCAETDLKWAAKICKHCGKELMAADPVVEVTTYGSEPFTTPPTVEPPKWSRVGPTIVCASVAIVAVLWVLNISGTPTEGERSAIHAISTLNTAQATYAARYPAQGFACALAEMGPPVGLEASSKSAGLLYPDMASGLYHGYMIAVQCGSDKAYPAGSPLGIVVSYKTLAFPSSLKNGRYVYCSDQTAVIRYATVEKMKGYDKYTDALADCTSWAPLQ